jgi:Tol biopolymer transport system component
VKKRSIQKIFILMISGVLTVASTALATTPGWNGRILFLNGSKIATMNPDGSDVKGILAPGPVSLDAPVASADGRIAFVQRAASGSQLMVMNADGSRLTTLTSGSFGVVGHPTWSPDGTKIAFEDQGTFGFPEKISVINSDGTNERVLLDTGGAFTQPAWSPDGTKIAVTANDQLPGSGDHISIINADGTGLTRLTTGKDDEEPNWSPDGTQIAFVANREVYRIKIDGTGLTNLTNGADSDHHPSWSPDGNLITFQTRRSGFEIWTMKAVDGSNRVRLTDCECAYSPDWTSWVGTAAGSNVSLQGNGVTVTFSNVTAPGTTTVTISSSCSGTPANFQVVACYDIHTTATFTGSVSICISYAGANFPVGVQPSIWHGVVQPPTTLWTDVTTTPVDTVNKIVCGSVTSLSPFAILGGASNRPPVAKCRNVTKSAGPSCNAAATAGEFNNGSSDPDGDAITFTLSPAGPFALGLTSVILTVKDNKGASSQCSATIKVVDDTPPAIVCPPSITVEFTSAAGAAVDFGMPSASDNCGSATITSSSYVSGSTFPIGTTTVTWTAMDMAANLASCTLNVTVLGARAVKENALADLIALRAAVTNSDDREQLDEAIGELRASLSPALWINQVHLQLRGGDDVFDNEKKSVSDLQKLMKNKRSSISDAALQSAINGCVKADRLLAEIAITEAAPSGRASDIEEARRELARGDSEAADGKFAQAIERYSHAWKKAMEAAQH